MALTTLRDLVGEHVRDGQVVALEGFTHLIPFAAGHEIIRQGRRDLTLARLTPDLIYDQMLAAGCAKKLIFSWAGNPGVGSLHALRRLVEARPPRPGSGAKDAGGDPEPRVPKLEIEEYSHFGMVGRFQAGASNLPFWPLRNYMGTDIPAVNPRIRSVTCPFTGEVLAAVPALRPDVTIVHVQRADREGNAQVWGLYGVQKEAAFASKRVIVVCEEIVDQSVIRADPNRTLIPGSIVTAVVHEPWGAHPSYAQGHYDRDNDFYVKWDEIARTDESLKAYLDAYVHGVKSRAEYMAKQPELLRLKAKPQICEGVSYGY